jgi:hypothetical protein
MARYRRVTLVVVAAAAAIAGAAGVANATDFTTSHSTQSGDGGYCGQSHYYDHFHGRTRKYSSKEFCRHHGRSGWGSPLDDGPFGALTNGSGGNYHEG